MIFVAIFFIWFWGSIIYIMYNSGQSDDKCLYRTLITFGQMFAVFGLMAIITSLKQKEKKAILSGIIFLLWD